MSFRTFSLCLYKTEYQMCTLDKKQDPQRYYNWPYIFVAFTFRVPNMHHIFYAPASIPTRQKYQTSTAIPLSLVFGQYYW